MNRVVTVVGSRETPTEALLKIDYYATKLAEAGYTLRSGGADGADLVAEIAFYTVKGVQEEIFLPWKGFNGNQSPYYNIPPRAFVLAREIHPACPRCQSSDVISKGSCFKCKSCHRSWLKGGKLRK